MVPDALVPQSYPEFVQFRFLCYEIRCCSPRCGMKYRIGRHAALQFVVFGCLTRAYGPLATSLHSFILPNPAYTFSSPPPPRARLLTYCAVPILGQISDSPNERCSNRTHLARSVLAHIFHTELITRAPTISCHLDAQVAVVGIQFLERSNRPGVLFRPEPRSPRSRGQTVKAEFSRC